MNKRRMWRSGLLLSVAVLLIVPTHLAARNRPGMRLGLYADAEDLFVGGDLLVPVVDGWFFNPNMEFVFAERATLVTFNFDFHRDMARRGAVEFWLGAGLAVIYRNPEGPAPGDTDLGVNLLFGVGIVQGPWVPYVQTKVLLAEDSELVLAVGVRF